MSIKKNPSVLYKTEKKNCPMVYIEGNVGVGKSTFLHFLSENLQEQVFYEPNDLWQDIGGYNLLEQFFIDQKRWAYTLQSYILTTRIDQLAQVDTNLCSKVCLVERSAYSGRYIFAKVAKEIGTMNGLEWCVYTKMWDREIQKLSTTLGGFIYLRSSVEKCYERIMQRGRMEEKPVTLDYLKRIEEKHENWFIKQQGVEESLAHAPILVLDFTPDLSHNHDLQLQYLDKIKNFIEIISNDNF